VVIAKGYKTDDIPALESGDHLTMEQFERRYAAMPELKKAELIEGVVFLASPVSLQHSDGQASLTAWAATYRSLHNEVRVHSDGSVRLDADNEFQPDIFIRKTEGGLSRPGERDLLDGPPELVIEVAASSVSRDLFAKKNVYRRNGVPEYVVWRVRDGELDWFELVDGEYVLRQPDEAGIIESRQFPGLRLDVPALLADDLARVLSAVR
jgi:Uma2 family endonuclease